jgi:hypothetical protein
MSRYVLLTLLTCAVLVLSACEKRTAKFRVHDKVKVKLTDTRGEVVLREQPFVDDLYFLKVAGRKSALDRSWLYMGFNSSIYAYPGEPDWHIEGPYYDTDLEATQ